MPNQKIHLLCKYFVYVSDVGKYYSTIFCNWCTKYQDQAENLTQMREYLWESQVYLRYPGNQQD